MRIESFSESIRIFSILEIMVIVKNPLNVGVKTFLTFKYM